MPARREVAPTFVDLLATVGYANGVSTWPELAAPQLPELGIQRVEGVSQRLKVTPEEAPWLKKDREVCLRLIQFVGGASMLYGSIVSGNSTLTKIAREVPAERSRQIQTALFTSLPDWLKGRDMPAIEPVPHQAGDFSLYKASRGWRDPPRLFFLRLGEQSGASAILKVAVARHKDQADVMGILTKLSSSGRMPRNYKG